jgi:hypothetical protein
MNLESVKELSASDRLLYWIEKRESIRRKKELNLDPPYTDDEILQKYRFCNVRRMDDRVSKWLLRNWYTKNKNHKNMLLACVIARHFNKIETLEEIGFPVGRPDAYLKNVRNALQGRSKVFGPAYVISGGTGAVRGVSRTKLEVVLDSVIPPILSSPPKIDDSSIQNSVESLVGYPGMGWFMAGQVVADLRWALTGTWRDKNVWAAKGPGSCRGLCRLLGMPVKANRFTQKQFVLHLVDTAIPLIKSLPPQTIKHMEAIDCQNCLCEYDKYSRVLLGEGRPKRLYRRS